MRNRKATDPGDARGGTGCQRQQGASKKYRVISTAILRPPLEILTFLPWLTTYFYFQGQLR